MNDLLIIDSDILIDVGRNDETAIQRLKDEEQKSILSISSVTEMELIVGCKNKRELKHLEKFLKSFEVINLSYEISQEAVGC